MKGVILFLLLVVSITYCQIDQNKVVLIDWTDKNYLFRGDEPKISNSSGTFFAYDQLKQYIIQNAKAKNVTIPDRFYLIDIKLYYYEDPFEDPDIILERSFFENNSDLGVFMLHQILGDTYSPNVIPKSVMIPLAKSLPDWQHDDLPVFIPSLNSLLYNYSAPNNDAVVIYFHCECGCDRTGEVAGSYVMKYKGLNYVQTYNWDYSIAGRWILPNHNWAMEWYCEYLIYVENRNIGPCDEEWAKKTIRFG